MKTLRTTSILWALTLLLAACGTSNSTVGQGTNLPPVAGVKLSDGSALSSLSYLGPNQALRFTASDADGSVTKLHWVIDAGQPLERSGDYVGGNLKASIDFQLPGLNSGSHTLALTVTDDAGATGTTTATFKVDAIAPTLSSVTVGGADVTEGQAVTFGSGDSKTLKVAASDIRGGGDASASSAVVLVYVGDTQVAKGLAPLTYDLAPTTSAQTVRVVAVDSAGNTSVVRTFTIQATTTAAAQEKKPAPVLTVVGTNPHSGNMTVNVSGNFDALSKVDRLVLQITDANGIIDNTTYTSTQAQATFSVDTTKLTNGDLKKLEVIAYTQSGLSNTTAYGSQVTISNLNSPLFSVASPADGATVTTPTVPVKVTLTTRGTPYGLSNALTVDILDSRGKVVLTKVLTSTSGPDLSSSPDCSGDNTALTCNLQFDMAGLPADTYTARARTAVTITSSGEMRSLETTSRFTSNTASLLPPAATVRFPAITNSRTVGRIDSSSGTLVNVSDDTGVAVVEARIVGPFDASVPLALNGTTQCQESVPVGTAVDVLLLNYGLTPTVALGDIFLPSLDIDGSAYVPDNQAGQRYDLRVTTIDTDKNRNIQCIPVTVNRALTKAQRIAYVTSTSTSPATPDPTPGKLNYSAGSWTISNLQNDSRVAGVVYLNGVKQSVAFTASTNTSSSVSVNFADEGTYQVVWLIEDMTTGIVTSQAGGYISVKRNPTQ